MRKSSNIDSKRERECCYTGELVKKANIVRIVGGRFLSAEKGVTCLKGRKLQGSLWCWREIARGRYTEICMLDVCMHMHLDTALVVSIVHASV